MVFIIEYILFFFKILNFDIIEVFLRLDNVGCYYCVYLFLFFLSLGECVGVKVFCYDYSEF